MKKYTISLLGAAMMLCGGASHADSSVTAKLSTLGLGVEYAHGVSEKWDVVGGINGFSYDYDQTSNKVDYKGKLDLNTITLGARYKPWGGAFFIQPSLVLNNNEVNMKAQAKDEKFTFNGKTYSAKTDFGSATAKADFPSVATMLNVGWQAELFDTGVTVMPEIGILFTGSPKLKTQINDCKVQSVCDAAEKDLKEEQAKIQKDLDNMKAYPLLSLGFGYRF